MHPRLFQTGPLLIPTYGVAAAVALVCGLLLAMRCARRLGLGLAAGADGDADAVWNLGLVAVFAAFVGSRAVLVATNWGDFLRFPVLMLAAAPASSGAALYGGLAAAVAASWAYMRWKRMPLLRTLDAAAPGLALGCAMLILGSLAAGSCYGRPTDGAWGIEFHAKFAALWYGTPLGVRLQPTQIYEAVAEGLLCALLLWMVERRAGPDARREAQRAQDGEIFGAWLFLGGAAHFVIEFYRGDPGRGSMFGGAMTLTQGLSLLAILEGGFLWMDRGGKRSGSGRGAEASGRGNGRLGADAVE